MKIAGFVKVRNEIIREGNLYRLFDQLESICDGGVLCDDASTDGTREEISRWVRARSGWYALFVAPGEQDFSFELRVKQQMLNELHFMYRKEQLDWILWMDGDELLSRDAERDLRVYLRERLEQNDADVIAMHYTQAWRSCNFARIDDGFDDGWFWKIWKYRSDLSFDVQGRLHHLQFPQQYEKIAVESAVNGRSMGRAIRCPYDIIHLGNYGKNLAWKAIQYRDSGPLSQASLDRHLRFKNVKLRPVDYAAYPIDIGKRLHWLGDEQMAAREYTADEIAAFERMGSLKQTPGLFTIIIPTYNRGYALDRTLKSVLDQTYKNWVCVVLDDGSTDDTPGIMRKWLETDPRFFYCRYLENRGGVAMNEIGMDLAHDFGEYWTRLGSDDYWLPHKLELDSIAFATGAKAVYGPYRDLHDPHGNGTDLWVDEKPESLRNPPHDATGALLSRGFSASWSNSAVHTDILRAIKARYGCYVDRRDPKDQQNPGIRNMEDWLFNIRVAYLTEFVWRGLVLGPDNIEGVVVGARSVEEAVSPRASLGGDLSRFIRYDGIWRIGTDGASGTGDRGAKDAGLTNVQLNKDEQNYKPNAREGRGIRVFPFEVKS